MENPQSIADGRPTTILGYIPRLASKLVADQVLAFWAATWPPEISGGLPRRSARDITLLQQHQLEIGNIHKVPWGGWTMDLVKAFNLIPRRVIRYPFSILGIAFWASSCGSKA